MNGELTPKDELYSILSFFPSSTSHAFAYGSGVFEQRISGDDNHVLPSSSSSSDNMIDFIFITPKAKLWHQECMLQRPKDYSGIARWIGSNYVAKIGRMGAGLYFNPLVTVHIPESAADASYALGKEHIMKQHIIKYGVMEEEQLKNDLKHWDTLYIAGRMHKPVATLIASDEVMDLQEKYNLQYALSTSLLLHVGKAKNNILHTSDLYQTIASLSYMGDPRMTAGAEDPDKLLKLVQSEGQMKRFHALYKNQFERMEQMGLLHRSSSSSSSETIEINLMDSSVRRALYQKLPTRLQNDTKEIMDFTQTSQDIHDSLHKTLKQSLASIVGPPARVQSVKGLFTAGLKKSIQYAAAKFRKGALKGLL
jgi:translocator assembly and maintenance protein 41